MCISGEAGLKRAAKAWLKRGKYAVGRERERAAERLIDAVNGVGKASKVLWVREMAVEVIGGVQCYLTGSEYGYYMYEKWYTESKVAKWCEWRKVCKGADINLKKKGGESFDG